MCCNAVMEKKITLSVALAVLNEGDNLRACLDSVRKAANEIIIVDGGSSDNTILIAEESYAHVIRTNNPLMFHINKQKALDACTGDWILQLDADEVVTDELAREIRTTIQDTAYNGFYIPRKNYFWGKFMTKGGQYPDYVIRLVKRGFTSFPCKSVHEQVSVDGNVGYLINPLLHYSYRTKEDYWRKADAYTTLTALELKQNKIPKNFISNIQYFFIKPIRTFFSLFVRHKGFLDGWRGFVFALWSALHYPIAYKKYEKNY